MYDSIICFIPCHRHESDDTQAMLTSPWRRLMMPYGLQSFRHAAYHYITILIAIHMVFLALHFSIVLHNNTNIPLANHDETLAGILDFSKKKSQFQNVHHKKDHKLRLRFDWTNLEPLSTLARRIDRHQTNCTMSLANFRYRNRFGLGSDLHIWGQAMCNAIEANVRLRTALPWIWLDQTQCSSAHSLSGMACYFPYSELLCPNDAYDVKEHESRLMNLTRARGRVRNDCKHTLAKYNATTTDLRAATTEYLFTRVSMKIQDEAERQLNLVFATLDYVPNDLITVHIRWGDKADEMRLVPVNEYVDAVQRILQSRASPGDLKVSTHANIFLATEDPRAVQEFIQAAPKSWNIYLDQYYREMLPYRRESYNGSPLMSQDLQGHPGLVALGSLLVAMEANHFVVTTASNWSRLLNELRKAVVHRRCGNCTTFIDLKSGEW